MAFVIYNSGDSGAPTLNGQTGSLITVLDACLVNGYGSRPAAGWTKPVPNTGSYGMYKQGTGTTCSLFVYDVGSGSAGGAEAVMTGWESITSFNTGSVTGSNPFPSYTQQALGAGAGGLAGGVILRKSAVPTAVARNWYVFADSSSMYMFVQTGDTANTYYAFGFGDIYSIKSGSIDNGRCAIIGRTTASSSAANVERLDLLSNTLSTAAAGHFALRAFSGVPGSVTLGKHGDQVKSGNSTTLNGLITYPNPADFSLYISPLWVVDNASSTIRGRMRGMYQLLHTITPFSDGTVFSGSGDFSGKVFMLIKSSGNGGIYTMEISDTLETNAL